MELVPLAAIKRNLARRSLQRSCTITVTSECQCGHAVYFNVLQPCSNIPRSAGTEIAQGGLISDQVHPPVGYSQSCLANRAGSGQRVSRESI